MNGPWPDKAPEGDIWDQRTTPHHGFVNVIRALAISGTAITQLSIDGWYGGISHTLFTLAQPQDLQHLATVISHLRKLKLQINTHKGEWSWQEACDSGRIKKLLAGAKSLEHFKLSFDLGEGMDLYYPSLDLARCFGNTVWEHLHGLELAHFEVDHLSLVEFLARQPALEDLSLVYLEFSREEYAAILDKFRQGTVVLKHCMLEIIISPDDWCWSQPSSELIIKYLRDGGRNPLRADEAGNGDGNENGAEGHGALLTSLS